MREVSGDSMAVGVPKGLRSAVKRLLPGTTVERLRSTVLRRYFVESLISRESRTKRFFRRMLARQRPVLYHLDVHLTDHCNLNCRGCEHYSSISDPAFADVQRTVRDLERLAVLFDNIEQVYLLGGEPLLHPQVETFVRESRRIFPHTRLYVMTNGVLVTRMPDSFWETLNTESATLLCDSYPINIDHERIDELGRTHGVTVEWMKPAEQFFKIPLDPTASCDPAKSFDRCRGLSNCAIVRDGAMYPCAHIAYADIPSKKFDLPQILPTEADSISIHGEVSGDEIIDFLMAPIPWCAHCDFDAFSRYEWSRGKGEPSEWIRTERETQPR
jgi:MoaA/NifB/PqqE/SkfB family radical SAM enzyme